MILKTETVSEAETFELLLAELRQQHRGQSGFGIRRVIMNYKVAFGSFLADSAICQFGNLRKIKKLLLLKVVFRSFLKNESKIAIRNLHRKDV